MSTPFRLIAAFLIIVILGLLGVIGYGFTRQVTFLTPSGQGLGQSPTPLSQKPLQKYAFSLLSEYIPQASTISLRQTLSQEPEYTSHLFAFVTDGKTMTGMLNVPTSTPPPAGFPVILMLRGFVDPGIYQTGIGTQNAAAAFAQNGYVTIAPDFLGYGLSDPPNPDVMGERLEKPLHVIDLLASISSLDFVNPQQLNLWAHSNGGQIALSVLEITQKPIPTTLWAPVSKPFPYSILYYTDEADDQGKALRASVAQFEQNYDVFDFSIDRYLDNLTGPLQIHQGTADDAVPLNWSVELSQTLQDLGKNITLFTYPGADHNLRQTWDTAIARDLAFFIQYANFTDPDIIEP